MRIITREDEFFPEKLKDIKPKIHKLYIEGDVENLNKFSIAVIGSRNCSKIGEMQAIEFTKKLTERGINIISGLAKGIDKIAHETCIQNNGKTIAVIGSGFKHIYPKENYSLYKKILETGGTIITEYSPDTEVNPKNFPKRNRIVSGLSDGILVIEGKHRSGTTITGQCGISQGKPVFCIPNSILNPYSTAPNSLIKKGAKLITTPSEIIKYFEGNGITFKSKNKKTKQYNNEILKLLSKEILTKEELAIKTNKSISEINQEITMLELEGQISENSGKGYTIIE